MMNTVATESTILTAASVSASTEPLSPEAYAGVLKKDQPARWQRFHANPDINVVVIDDNKETCLRLRNQLGPFYGTRVKTFNFPSEGIAEIRAKQAAGKSCVLVLDLHMPEKTGLQVLKELGVDCPPVVVNTASIMKPVWQICVFNGIAIAQI
jgi:CheY-like chemotaxis protein